MKEFFTNLYTNNEGAFWLVIALASALSIIFLLVTIRLIFGKKKKVTYKHMMKKDKEDIYHVLKNVQNAAVDTQELLHSFEEEINEKNQDIELKDERVKELEEAIQVYEQRIKGLSESSGDSSIIVPQNKYYRQKKSKASLLWGVLIGTVVSSAGFLIFIFWDKIIALFQGS